MATSMVVEVLIIGAGPSGAVAAALLCRQGLGVLVLEREQFPRFSIGESLLPQSMEYLEQAGMLDAVQRAGFQIKNGAAFGRGEQYSEFDFSDKFSAGWSYTYEVPRARFDHLLALEAERQGAEIRFRHEVIAVDLSGARPRVTIKDDQNETFMVEAGFILDASGFGRVLPRLLGLERPSDFPVRGALFTHVEDRIASIPPKTFDRNKIRINVQPDNRDLWYWVIPFSDGRCSIGVVGGLEALARYQGTELERLRGVDRGRCCDRPIARPGTLGYAGAAAGRVRLQRQFVVRPRLRAARQCRRVSRSDFFFRCDHRFQISQSGGGSGAAPARRRVGRLGAGICHTP